MISTLSQVDEASKQVAAGSDNLAQAAQSLAEGATEQADTLQHLDMLPIYASEIYELRYRRDRP